MVTCCFAGHREVPSYLWEEVIAAVEKLIETSDCINFYSGCMGDFDKLCEQVVREVKKRHPEKSIRLCWVLPSYHYVPNQSYKRYLDSLFDDIFVCEASDGAHYKAMIGKRNRWMVEQSEFMIAYVMNESGGAYSSLKYAQKRNLNIIRIGMNKR